MSTLVHCSGKGWVIDHFERIPGTTLCSEPLLACSGCGMVGYREHFDQAARALDRRLDLSPEIRRGRGRLVRISQAGSLAEAQRVRREAREAYG